MCIRDVVIFLAAAEFFHTLGHVVMSYVVNFPLDVKFMVMTSTMNNYAIGVNAIITVLLLWWAKNLYCTKCEFHND